MSPCGPGASGPQRWSRLLRMTMERAGQIPLQMDLRYGLCARWIAALHAAIARTPTPGRLNAARAGLRGQARSCRAKRRTAQLPV
ncbi:hypothetical protein XarbCFBP7408_17735 [Xanthomonas arboricola pv. guizotiae]|uniref:Uncharacterized protein n=1 Tax=Xanthomonas arboricola pv. guizotiae TaxID=487867 RepID=A0A2S6ZV94_9XANT|nr:hypothetical protein XarbCFBP7409_15655 [Xanthomonas arboricola pv. guizotiae]PPU20550.1 hypothetical protein XarbCFBP7408_17735 [Xanthomonas arboricola pv. guizotiae]